jgi:hypothetical protein
MDYTRLDGGWVKSEEDASMRDSRRRNGNAPHKVRDAIRESRPDPGSSERDQLGRARATATAMAAIRDASFAIAAWRRMMAGRATNNTRNRNARPVWVFQPGRV